MKRILCLCLCVLLLCGCAMEAPDVYQAGALTLPAITDQSGGEKRLLRAELIEESDPVRAAIYTEQKRYVYDEITDAEKQAYFEKLKEQGCFAFSENCMQSAVNKNGEFIEITVEGNTVTVSAGKV